MSIHKLAEMTWTEVEALSRDATVVILPLGATEAHGPHLPIATDVLLAEGMAVAAAEALERHGLSVLLLPPMAYSAAPFASGFAGTLSIRPETAVAWLLDLVRGVWDQGFSRVALANSHFDPTHLKSIYEALETLAAEASVRGIDPVVFPDVTRRRLATRLTEEFQSGACHAGRYEGSMVMALRPDLVRVEKQAKLPDVPISLTTAMREGIDSFEAAGGDLAYFGAPSEASRREGEETLEVLGEILAEAIIAAS